MIRDLTNQTFGKLTVISLVPKEQWSTKRAHWLVQCSCGSEPFIVRADYLTRGYTWHCDCTYIAPALKHGMSNSPEYRAWSSMIQRCTNPKASGFEHYGGRGIKVDPAWLDDFEQFYEDIGLRPSDDHSLDRIDVNGDYVPTNVQWSTRKFQVMNQRRYLKYR